MKTSDLAYLACCAVVSDAELAAGHLEWIKETIHGHDTVRKPQWTEALAVGSRGLVNGVLETLGVQARAGGFDIRPPGIGIFEAPNHLIYPRTRR